ncbi:MAG: hypothetical protein JSU94_06400 [Phycisphaerales bacterium]|nr:MAG: hypothetical protein JSU94_06400 [Phycisphaerales bacterium]
MKKNNLATASFARRLCLVLIVLPAPLLMIGCAGGDSFFAQNFPKDFVDRARRRFETDITGWEVSQDASIPGRIHLVLSAEPSVESDFRNFCELTILRNLRAHRFELATGAPARLVVCIVKASEVRRPVRLAKVRLAVSLRSPHAEQPVLLGICDGIVPRPDLTARIPMPKSSYLGAAHHAIARLMQQLSTMPREL